MPKKGQNRKIVFSWIFFCWEAFTFQISEILSNGLDFANFLNFWSILAVFYQKRPKNVKIKKKVFCCIFFCWEVSTYQISQNVIKRFGFCQFSSSLVNFGCFLPKKCQIRSISKDSFLLNFLLMGSIYTKFQKILSNSLDFANFLPFRLILAVF